MQKESTKNLKYYWDNRYSYIVNFVKKYLYLMIVLCIFLFLFFLHIFLSDKLNSNEFLLFFCFFVFLFICFFLFLFFCFSKNKAIQLSALTSFGLFFIFFAWIWGALADFPTYGSEMLFFLKSFFYNLLWSLNVSYALALLFALSLNAIIFYFMKEKHFKKNEENSFNNLTFIIFTLFWILLPYLTYLTTSSTFLTPNILN